VTVFPQFISADPRLPAARAVAMLEA